MAEIRTGFKVCTKRRFGFERRAEFKSAFGFGRSVDYEINVWTHQPEDCGPLAVFERLCDVDDFLSHNITLRNFCETFLCEFETSDENKLYDNIGNEFEHVPHGTAFATKVKLVKKLRKL